jgi:hypothetical protein
MVKRIAAILILLAVSGCSTAKELSAPSVSMPVPSQQDLTEDLLTSPSDRDIQKDLRPNSNQESDPDNVKTSLYRQLISVRCVSNCTNDRLWAKCVEAGFNNSEPGPADEVIFARDLKNHLLQWVETRTVVKTVPRTRIDSLGVVYSDDSQKVEVERQETIKGYCNGYEYILKR